MRRTRFDERRPQGLKKPLLWVILACVIAFFWYKHNLTPVDASSEQRVPLVVEKGSSTAAIAHDLKEKDLIRSPWAFNAYVRLHGKAADLKAGSFVFTPSMGVREIVDSLAEGQTGEMSVTIPEGYTVFDIDALLTEKGLIESGEFAECALTCDFSSFTFLPDPKNLAARGGKVEGYLYPDTYFVDPSNFVPKFFLERLLGTFRSKVIDGLDGDIAASGRSLHEIVTMASLVEEETRTGDERAIVAGILWKRFDEGIGLYVDATTRYIAEKPTAALTTHDLDVDSAYNTRKYRGLPPGAIASPSLSSIKATLHPESSPYYYYLHGSDGKIRYAVTNDEHNANKTKYL